jgi:hypothetical protein
VRLLIAAEEAVEHPSQIPAGVRVLIEAATEIWVMSPSLVSPIQWLTGGVDEARQSADRRLEVVLGQLAAEGISASGARSGDELGPTAFDDALRQFPADHIIIGLRSSKKGPWQRQQALDHLVDRHDIPITIFRART